MANPKTTRFENATAAYVLCAKGKTMKPWKEKTVRLENATVLTLEGPGPEWVCVLRGKRDPWPPKRRPSRAPRRRAKGGRR